MDQAGERNRQRALRHATPERVREFLHAYRHRAARDRPSAPRGGARPVTTRRSSSSAR